jgi:hypothetical protein
MLVTASKQNRVPYEGSCNVLSGIEESAGSTIRMARIEISPSLFMKSVNITLESDRPVDFKIYDLSGKLVQSFTTAKSTVWKGDDLKGHRCSAGIYFLRAEGTGLDKTYRLVLLK